MADINVGSVYVDFYIKGVDNEIKKLYDQLKISPETGVAAGARREAEKFQSVWGGVFSWFRHSWKYFVVSAVWVGIFSMMYQFDQLQRTIMDTIDTLRRFAEESAKLFADVSYNIKLAAHLAGASEEELAKAIRDVSLSLGFTQQELSNVAVQLARAGVEAKALPQLLQLVAKAALATGEDMETLGGYIVAMSKSYGETYADVANKLVEAGNLARGTAGEVAYALAFIGPYAKELGMTFEEAAAWAVYLNNLGNNMRRAAFWIRNAMQQLITGERGAIQFFQDLGIAVRDTNKPLMDFDQMLVRLKTSIRALPLDEAKKRLLGVAEALGIELGKLDVDKIWIKLKNELAKLPLDETKQKILEIAEVLGVEIPKRYKSTSDMFDYLRSHVEMTDESISKLISVLKDMGVTVEKDLPPMGDMIKIIATELIKRFKDGTITLQQAQKAFSSFGITIDLSGGKIRNFMDLIDELRKKVESGAISADELKVKLTDAFGIGAEALLPLITMTDKQWQEFRKMVGEIGEATGGVNKLANAQSKLATASSEASSSFENLISKYRALREEGKNLEDANKSVAGVLDKQAKLMQNTAKITMERVQAMWQDLQMRVGEAVAPVYGRILSALSGFVDRFGDKIAEIFGAFADAFGELLSNIDMGTIQSLVDAFTSFGNALIDIIVPVLSEMSKELLPVLADAVQAVAQVLEENKDDLISTFKELISVIVDNKDEIIAFVKDALWLLVQALKLAVKLVEALTQNIVMFEEVLSGIRDTISPFRDQLNYLGEAINALNTIFSVAVNPLMAYALAYELMTGKVGVATKKVLEFMGSIQKLIKPVVDATGAVISAFTGLQATTLAVFNTIYSSVLNIWGNLMSSLVSKLRSTVANIIATARNMVSTIVGMVRGLWDTLTRHSIWTDMWRDMLKYTNIYADKNIEAVHGMVSEMASVLGSVKPPQYDRINNNNTIPQTKVGAGNAVAQSTINVTITIENLSTKNEEDLEVLANMISEKIKEEVVMHGSV